MTNRPIVSPASVAEPEEIVASRQELQVLEALAYGVSAHLADLSRKPQSLGRIDATEFAVIENRHARLKAFQELAHACYGRTVIGTEVDESDRSKGSFTYRITQANVGYVEQGCFVLARNSRLATQLVTAQPGDERDVATPGGDRYLNVQDVRVLDGPVSLRLPTEEPNFRSMAIRRRGLKKPVIVEDLRATLQRFSMDATALKPLTELDRFDRADPTWLIDWTGIYLGDSDNQSLGHQFMTRTTEDQERALNNPRGLTFVEGIAGAGKTSVALGRLKFFANFETGAEREYYGLQNASTSDFAPAGMMGFVLSHSLRGYLRETAAALELAHLPIKDFEEFRGDLSNRFGIANRFRKKKSGGASLRSRFHWLRALDVAMARAAGERLRGQLADVGEIPKSARDDLARFADSLLNATIQAPSEPFYLSELASRVVTLTAEGELRDQEDRARETFQVREEMDPERRRREELNLDREMRRIQEQAEKKIVSPAARRLLEGLTSHELFVAAIGRAEFPALVHRSFPNSDDPRIVQDLNGAVAEIRGFLSQGVERPALIEDDLVALVIFAAMISAGFDFIDQSGSLNHMHQIRKNTAVFIDEVQDFTEIELVLMGLSARNAYHQITLSGDRCQQLQSEGATDFENLFPWVPKSSRNSTIFLDHNFRQRPELAALSAGFRFLILGDNRVELQPGESMDSAAIYRFDERGRMARLILERVRTLPHHATVAVITPSADKAEEWFDLLEEELSAYHRPALLSRRDDLTKRINIHFTEVREAKGLEFDVVIVPDIASFELDRIIGCNQAYVAISRAKHSLLLGCATNSASWDVIENLRQKSLIDLRDVPSS
ncbi:ATP-binding domain-containing protein [Bradyrhizobium sp.]|uniref:ATP-binding domain-containing protein n=1 Tax=Bradyrhizobium sp. TaxID=376 RepID=UPI0039E4AABF